MMLYRLKSFDGMQIEISKCCPSYYSPAEMGPVESGPAEICIDEIGLAEMGPVEISIDEIDKVEIGTTEVGPFEIGIAEIGIAEIGPFEISIDETSVAEVRCYAKMLLPPLIPNLYALHKNINMLLVRHNIYRLSNIFCIIMISIITSLLVNALPSEQVW